MTGAHPTSPIHVLIADDHALFRMGIGFALDPDVRVVGEACDGDQAIKLAVEHQPDIVLMDVHMPGTNGVDACARIREAVPGARVLIISMSDDTADLFHTLKAGATGYLMKTLDSAELSQAIRDTHQGIPRIERNLYLDLLRQFAELAKQEIGPAPGPVPVHLAELTARERQVLSLLAHPLNNRQIGQKLFITENTVKNHVRSILEKLGVHSRTEAAIYAIRFRGGSGPR